MRTRHTVAALVLTVALAAPASAQSHGRGHMAGVVKDDAGHPVEGVQVKAVKSGEKDAFNDKTNKKGEWAINGIAGGQWNLDFTKEGFETRKITVPLQELGFVPPMEVAITRTVVKVDPNAEIKGELQKAAPLMEAGKFAEARAIYDPLLAKYPEAWQIEPLIARTYAGENKPAEATRHLKTAMQHDPDNVELKLLMASLLSQQGKTAEVQAVLDGIDMTKVTDPVVFLNQGINLINQGKAAEALPIFEKLVSAFPKNPDGFYYRGRCELALGKFPEAKADLQKFIAMPGADAAEVEQAKKILEQMK
jgi:thioredoxin-like negative regulator of GroEL